PYDDLCVLPPSRRPLPTAILTTTCRLAAQQFFKAHRCLVVALAQTRTGSLCCRRFAPSEPFADRWREIKGVCADEISIDGYPQVPIACTDNLIVACQRKMMVGENVHFAIAQIRSHLVNVLRLSIMVNHLESDQRCLFGAFRLNVQGDERTHTVIIFGDAAGAMHDHAVTVRLGCD